MRLGRRRPWLARAVCVRAWIKMYVSMCHGQPGEQRLKRRVHVRISRDRLGKGRETNKTLTLLCRQA